LGEFVQTQFDRVIQYKKLISSSFQKNFFVPLGNALAIAADTAKNMVTNEYSESEAGSTGSSHGRHATIEAVAQILQEMGGKLSDFAHDQREEYHAWEHWLNLKKQFLGRIDGLEESLKAEVEDGS
jgi:hypothetical protein